MRKVLLLGALAQSCGDPGLVAAVGAGPAKAGPDNAEHTKGLGARLLWVGDTHLRYDGYWIPSEHVMSNRDLEVYTQTYPRGAVDEVRLYWRVASEGVVGDVAMDLDVDHVGPYQQNVQWKARIPGDVLRAESVVQYWIRAQGKGADVLWDSRGGDNYDVVPKAEVTLLPGPESRWISAGLGSFEALDGIIQTHPGGGLGLDWCAYPTPRNFELALEWSKTSDDDNAGVFVRFPDPRGQGYDNEAWVPVHFGFEIQIDDLARPDGRDLHRTGAIYGEPTQTYARQDARPVGEWNEFRVRVVGSSYLVLLNGVEVSRFVHVPGANPVDPPTRGLPGTSETPRFFGLQAHTGTVRFRNIRLRSLPSV